METATGQEWRLRGACGNHDPDIWFPTSNSLEAANRAKAICLTCPVRAQCLEYATVNEVHEGIWGGTTPTERWIRTAVIRRSARSMAPEDVQHGTPSGYMWHRRYSPPVCDACRAAETARGTARRKARREAMASA